jgi:hypothetical protein
MNPDPYPSGVYSTLSYPSLPPTAAPEASKPAAAPAPATRPPQRFEIRTPTWAVIATIVGFFVAPGLNLLFLLVKEKVPVPSDPPAVD